MSPMPSSHGTERLSPAAFHWHPGMSYRDAISFPALVRAAEACACNVRWKPSVQAWLRESLERSQRLHEDLVSGRYRLSPYVTFRVTEPKLRLIRATGFRDRVVQRAMCDNGLYDQLTRGMIYDNAACRKGKGTLFARSRLRCHLARQVREQGPRGWILKLDIRHYFDSIPHGELKRLLAARVTDRGFLFRLHEIVDSYGDRGLGLGSQLCQLMALVMLDPLDHFIKERLRIRHYVRYMDDMVLLDGSRERLLAAWQEIAGWLSLRGLELNRKSCLVPLSQGICFLGRRFRVDQAGRLRVRPRRNAASRERRILRRLLRRVGAGSLNPACLETHLEAWCASVACPGASGMQRRVIGMAAEGLKEVADAGIQDQGAEREGRAGQTAGRRNGKGAHGASARIVQARLRVLPGRLRRGGRAAGFRQVLRVFPGVREAARPPQGEGRGNCVPDASAGA